MTIQYIVRGDLDAEGMRRRQQDWARLSLAEDNVRLDLSGVRKMDSSGLGAVLFLFKRLSAARKSFEIVNASGQPLIFLSQFGLHEIMGPQPRRAQRRLPRIFAQRLKPRAQRAADQAV